MEKGLKNNIKLSRKEKKRHIKKSPLKSNAYGMPRKVQKRDLKSKKFE